MPETIYDVIIVGAGPAGCTTALWLADSGLKVAVVDKAILPNHKICGDALSGTTLDALRRLPGNCFRTFLETVPGNPSWGIRFTSPGGEVLDIPFLLEKGSDSPPPGYLVDRKHFDGFLQDRVTSLTKFPVTGNFPVREVVRYDDTFRIKGENGEMSCRMLIGADGVHSTVGRLLANHTRNKKQYCVGVRAYFTGVSDLNAEQFIELNFLEEILPGYFWIFRLPGGIVNAGLGILYEKLKTSPESLADLMNHLISNHPALSHRFRNAEMQGKIEAHGLPLGPDNKRLSGDGFLLTGDAASLVDPFTGEGIGNAMISGEIAAGVIIDSFKSGDLSGRFLSSYDTLIHKKLERDLKTSHRIQELCAYPSLFNLVVKKANRSKELKELFTNMFTSPDALEQLKSPAFYLKVLWS